MLNVQLMWQAAQLLAGSDSGRGYNIIMTIIITVLSMYIYSATR